MRLISVLMGVLLFVCMRFESDFKTVKDFFATFVVMLFPTLLILVPLVLEFLEKRN